MIHHFPCDALVISSTYERSTFGIVRALLYCETARGMKPIHFHPVEDISPRQIKHKEKDRNLSQCAEEKGLRITRTAFGVGHFVFLPDGKRVRYTSYTKLTEFIENWKGLQDLPIAI